MRRRLALSHRPDGIEVGRARLEQEAASTIGSNLSVIMIGTVRHSVRLEIYRDGNGRNAWTCRSGRKGAAARNGERGGA